MNSKKNITKKLKRINKQKKRKNEEVFHNYFLSISYIYMVVFAVLHYFLDKDSHFINTFGVLIINIIANFIYLKIVVKEFEISESNNYFRRINKSEFCKQSLINKKSEGQEIVAFKVVFILALVFVYILCCTLSKKIEFMDSKNAFDFMMFYLSTIYIDAFWNGRSKKLLSNLIPRPPEKEKNIKMVQRWFCNFKISIQNLNLIYEINEKNAFKRIIFWIFLLAIMMYQPYQVLQDMLLLI